MKVKPKLYGAEWCPKTSGFRNYFQNEWIDFEYFDIESNAKAEQEVKDMNDGKIKFPMVVVGNFKLKNPSIPELNKALKANDLL